MDGPVVSNMVIAPARVWTRLRPMPHVRLGLYSLCAVALIGLAAAIRVDLIALGWPQLNSDEGTMGLMALHIAQRGEHPVFFYGQSYMGALEAYLGAGLFRLFGVSEFDLRLGLVLLFVLFLLTVYRLARQLYDQRTALLAVALLTPGSKEMLFQQLQAVGRVETWPLASLALLLALRLTASRGGPYRLATFTGWGLVVGLALWSDVIVAPFLLMAAVLLALFCRRELIGRAGLCLLLGLVIGSAPLLAYSAHGVPYRSSAGFFAIGTGSGLSAGGRGVAGALLVALPLMTGANAVCPVSAQDAWPLSVRSSPRTVACTAVHGAWSVGILLLCLLSAGLSLAALRRVRARPNPSQEERAITVKAVAQLAILAGAGLILLIYVLSPSAASLPWLTRRYLTPLWVALPIAIAPLSPPSGFGSGSRKRLWRACRYGLIACLLAVLFLGTAQTLGSTPAIQRWDRYQAAFAANLLRLGATRIYSDYWTCDRLAFQSRERVLCSVLDNRLHPGQDRYLAYRSAVRTDPHAAYALPLGSAQARAFARRPPRSGQAYRRFYLEGYVVYRPASDSPSVDHPFLLRNIFDVF